MSHRNLWIFFVISLFLLVNRFVPGFGRFGMEAGLIGLVVCAILAFRGMRTKQNVAHYQWILALCILVLISIVALVLYVFLSLGGLKFF